MILKKVYFPVLTQSLHTLSLEAFLTAKLQQQNSPPR
jgi:hypothetical protein